ncbi:MAG: type II toxin-antitoxin system VapC family toxin [Rhodocyclales bacterium]|nr:type II toxin-antitoxin system VapC family toxin [Rhodocyclales bacterium]
MGACVLDTNAVVYYLNRYGGEGFRSRFQDMVRQGAIVSVITRIEVLGWPGYAQTSAALADAEALLSLLREEPLTDRVVATTIALRRSTRLRVPDAAIAATALVLDLPLATSNLDDFKAVDGLRLIDPLQG